MDNTYDFSEKEVRLAELLASLPYDDKRKAITNLMSLVAGIEPSKSHMEVDFMVARENLGNKAKKEAHRLLSLYPQDKELIEMILEGG